jgi:hypothetical protein
MADQFAADDHHTLSLREDEIQSVRILDTEQTGRANRRCALQFRACPESSEHYRCMRQRAVGGGRSPLSFGDINDSA